MCEQENMNQHTSLQAKRLHPAGMLFSFIGIIKDTILGLGIGVFATFRQSPTYALLFVALFIIFLIASSILSWFRYTYRVEEGELRIEEGIFVRKKRFISIHRIHKIDMTANVLHRLIGLVKVQVDTASSGSGAEVSLSAVTKTDAHRLQKALESVQPEETHEQPAEKDYPSQKITWKRLFIAGTTSGSVGLIFVGFFIFFGQIQQFIPEQAYTDALDWLIHLGVMLFIGLAIFSILALWVIGIAGTMLKYGNFQIEKRENELFIKRGLLETKELTIPFDRIQAIEIEQSLIRQPIKFVRIVAVVAGGSFEKGEPFPVLFPLMHVKDVEGFLQTFLPDYQDVAGELIPLAKKGRKYYLVQAMIVFILAFIPVVYFFPMYSWIPAIFIILAFLYGQMKFKETGFRIDDKRLIFRYRNFWIKNTVMTFKRRIQVTEKKQHKLQRMENLATVKISTIGQGGAGTHFALKHVKDEDANEIAAWYSYRDTF